MNRFHHLVMMLLMFGFMTGCGRTTSATEQFTQRISEIDGLQSLSTGTALPSFMPSPSATPSQTKPVFDQAIDDGTLAAAQTRVARFPSVCQEGYSHQNFSPNGL